MDGADRRTDENKSKRRATDGETDMRWKKGKRAVSVGQLASWLTIDSPQEVGYSKVVKWVPHLPESANQNFFK